MLHNLETKTWAPQHGVPELTMENGITKYSWLPFDDKQIIKRRTTVFATTPLATAPHAPEAFIDE